MDDPHELHIGIHRDQGLEVADLADDPVTQFRRWYEDAEAEGIHMENAIALATADASGVPSVRHVLLRRFDERGFVFYTNHTSRKGQQLGENPVAAFAVFWRELDRQVCVAGAVERVSDEESDAYFATRPREARIGAWASPQSEVLADREALLSSVAEFDARYPGDDVPRPPFWGGYRLVHDTVEFWQGRAFRLHDRFRYARGGAAWRIERLAP